eukprot:SAG31_NODE_812_length_11915_cov_64.697360_5_plen_81_part_00
MLVVAFAFAFVAQYQLYMHNPPFNPNAKPGQTYDDSIAVIRDRCSFLSEDEVEWILRKTAQKVFFDPLPQTSVASTTAAL